MIDVTTLKVIGGEIKAWIHNPPSGKTTYSIFLNVRHPASDECVFEISMIPIEEKDWVKVAGDYRFESDSIQGYLYVGDESVSLELLALSLTRRGESSSFDASIRIEFLFDVPIEINLPSVVLSFIGFEFQPIVHRIDDVDIPAFVTALQLPDSFGDWIRRGPNVLVPPKGRETWPR